MEKIVKTVSPEKARLVLTSDVFVSLLVENARKLGREPQITNFPFYNAVGQQTRQLSHNGNGLGIIGCVYVRIVSRQLAF